MAQVIGQIEEAEQVTKPPLWKRMTKADWCVLVLVTVSAVWCMRAEIPTAMHNHFANLDEVEFLSLGPVCEYIDGDGEFVQVPDQGLGYANGSVVIKSQSMHPNQVLGKIRWADRLSHPVINPPCACFNPGYAIRDPYDHDNVILLDVNCSRCVYVVDQSRESAAISSFSDSWFRNLANDLKH